MKQAFTKRFLLISLLLPFQVMIANTPAQPCVQVQDKSHFVYLSTEMRRAVECLNRMLPDHKWSPMFKDVCDRIAKDGIAAPYAEAEAVVVECLNLLDGNNCAELQEVQDALKRYADALRKGDANLVLIDDNGMITRACGSCNTSCNTDCNTDCRTDCRDKCIKFKKTKAFCNLFAHDLQVDGSAFIANLTSRTVRITGNLVVDGEIINGEGTEIFDNLTVEGTFTANGTSNIGANAVDNAINIGTGALTGRPVTIGNLTGTSSLTLRSGTGDIAITSTDAIISSAGGIYTVDAVGLIDINSSAGVIGIGTDPVAQAINIGTGAAARPITIGNATAGTTIALNANGLVSVAGQTQTAASPTAAVTFTPATRVGQATFTGFTTAAAASQVFTITDSLATATSTILVTAENGGTNDAQMTIQRVNPAAGSFAVTLKNNGAAALNGDVLINFWILN